MKSLLINWVYYRPIGHVIEALRLACDIARADAGLRISLALNAEAPAELVECVDCVEHVYRVDVERRFPKDLPREWDYVLIDPRASTPSGWPALDRFHQAFRERVNGTRLNPEDPAHMLPRKIEPLRLKLPQRARDFAAARLTGDHAPRVSVLFGAASQMRAPSLAFWTRLFDAFFERHPNGALVLLGKLQGGGSRTRGITARDIQSMCDRYPAVHDAFDIGLLEQLALAERCQLHISPHSGMSFAVQAVGVSWLAISGQEWHEFMLNGVPLVSIFPDCPLYPCFREMYPECRTRIRDGVRTPCIEDEALFTKLPQIIAAMESLLAGEIAYRPAAEQHEKALRERLGPDSWSIIDWPAVIADDYVY